MDYLKIGRADELTGRDRKIYRYLEILPGFLSWFTLLILIIASFIKPVWVAFFIIAFDTYWLLLVVFLSIHLLVSYRRMKRNVKIDWQKKCLNLKPKKLPLGDEKFTSEKISYKDVIQVVILPVYNESTEIISSAVKAIIQGKYPAKRIILALTVEERGGKVVYQNAENIKEKYQNFFYKFILTKHPDNIPGELKGKGANQTWAAGIIKKYIDKRKLPYEKILVSVFDIDTIIYPDYFYCLVYNFLTAKKPYRASYQPVPVYHNNIWQAPFFSRVAASSNTFWQMMQQIRQEKLATYSSHSMSWQTLVEIGFWSTTMVSEDSRIFWHCFCYYYGDYEVIPLNYPVSMDATMDKNIFATAKSLYKQQRRWGWGVENVPYLIFNTIKRWQKIDRKKAINRILVQIYGFHSWATNAIIIAFIGWLPIFFGGEKFDAMVLSTNLPIVTRNLMLLAMAGMIISAIVSMMLLPKKPQKFGVGKHVVMFAQWIILPISIIFFGAIPGLEAQTRLMLGKYLGFFVTPKER